MTHLIEPHAAKPPPPEPPPLDRVRPGSRIGLIVLLALVALGGLTRGWPLLVMIGSLVGIIFMHELGHFLTAKVAGMKVTEFFIGFGPRIWSFRRGETEYGIKPIPLGAYVRIVGMNNLDEHDPADAERTYMSKPFRWRLLVVSAGSLMHFLMAGLALFVLFAFVGVPGGALTSDAWAVADTIERGTPAAEAGIEAGDRILSVDGISTATFDDFGDVVRERPGETVPVVIERDGDRRTLEVTLARENPRGERVGFFGVGRGAPPPETVGIGRAVGETVSGFGYAARETVSGLGRLLSPSGLGDLGSRVLNPDDAGPTVEERGSGGAERTSDGDGGDRVISIIGVTVLGSDILEDGDASIFLLLFVVVNVFIGIFNMLPLLPLDGGHVAIATYEKIRTMLRGGHRYQVDVAKLLPMTYAVVAVLVFLGLSTMYLDTRSIIGG
ncbi:MAG: M50 family metallopeptidase [Acidimicrobiales bacterium]